MTTITSTEAGATGRYIDLGTSPANNVDVGAQTIIVYCNPSGSGGGGFAYHIGKTSAGSVAGLRFFIGHGGGSPSLSFGVDSSGTAGGPQRNGTLSEVTYSSWQHHEATWDGGLASSGIHLYINGTESTYGAGGAVEGSGSINSDSAKNLFLMNRGNSGNLGREFVGDQGYVARWNRVLTTAERQTVREMGPLAVTSGLILCWANNQDYSTNAITAAGRSTRVTGGTPTVTMLDGYQASASEALSLSHSQALPSGAYSASITEGMTLAESASNSAALGASATESMTLADTQSTSGAFTASITESMTLADASSNVAALSVSKTESMALADSQSQITLDASYERSSADLAQSSVVGAGNSAIVSIYPVFHTNESIGGPRWMEPSVDVVGVNGFKPTFRFLSYLSGSNGYHGHPWATGRRPVYSYDDGVTWTYFDTNVTLDNVNNWVEFQNSTAFTQNKVRISRGPQVTVHQTGDWLASLATTYSSFFGPSPAAVTYTPTGSVSGYAAQTFIADEFSAQTDSIGKAVPITPFYAAEINDTSLMPLDGSAKRIAMVAAGVHAGEDTGDIHMRAFVEYFCGSSTKAQNLRRQYRLFIYPMMNAPGRAGGSFRGSWTTGTGGCDDLNRHFHETGSALETVDKPKAVMNTDRAGVMFDWVLDFHGDHSGTWSMFMDSGDTYQTALKAEIETEVGYSIGAGGASVTGMVPYTWKSLGTRLGVTYETGTPSQISLAQMVANGESIVRALDNMRASGLLFPNGTLTEAVTLAASQDVVLGFAVSNTGALTLADSPNASLSGNFTATQTEAMTLADTASNVAALSAAITEPMSLDHSQSDVAALSASISEPMTLADIKSASASGDYTANITEASALEDTSSNVATLNASITETSTLADISSASSPGNFSAIISESLALAEIASNQAALSAALVEALSLSDNAASAWSRFVSLIEAMNLSDSASQTLNAIITESTWLAYSVDPQDLHYSVDPQDLTFSITTLALAGGSS